ncbi:transcriptional regulator [Mangrovimonas yunxiaonensis]|uniref:Transcriptional regulator n=1 Tax=Mangrovimonas yunxiaonensis TaxID=1197477 RepID=A0A084TIB2_9FLAO|nr:FMN-binding negative transcriptional regulator [Mangrovimonas yunxiaonensis]KFB00448.1 transcriptional regulator [Mangrovimonas yunxiaonensis]GGH34682.1 transcriptional regulator [Mangrovimonas yunxiaonensis]
MAYPPKIHQDDNKDHMLAVIQQFPLATVISVKDNEALVTHLPLIYKNGKLVGHLDKFNPQAEVLQNNQPVTVIFSGSQCYISPSIYKTEQLPTWNYVKVHLKGSATAIETPEAIKQSMLDMTTFLEPENAYVLKANDPKMEAYLPYVKGFEITISHWEGKFKLSQNRNKEDFELATQELMKRHRESIELLLNRIL